MATPPRVAYQGVPGAFGEEAIRRHWRGHAEAWPARTFAGALEALVTGAVEWAVVPIWNSTIGSVTPACAALAEHASAIVRDCEVDIPVHHCLLALPGVSIESVRFVGSHPAAIAQCARLFQRPQQLTPCEAFDTAGAALELSRYGDSPVHLDDDCWYGRLQVDGPSRLAAIASADAARHYGLAVLESNVHDDPANVTRFVVVRVRTAASR